MEVILLSGGSGNRLWPLSNNVRSKQFLKILKNDDEQYESLIQRIYRNLQNIECDITVALPKNQISTVKSQLNGINSFSVEPSCKGTFNAMVLSALYLREKNVQNDEVLLFVPIDAYANADYFQVMKLLANSISDNKIGLIGIKPTYPSEKYGYILKTNNNYSFIEKPNIDKANSLIENGALWNSGVVAITLENLIKIGHKYIEFDDYEDLLNKYNDLEINSFDKLVLEKAENLLMIEYGGTWKDIGTWNTLTESMDDEAIGNVIKGNNNSDVSIINELNIPILYSGLNNLVIAASGDGILISDKGESSYIAPYVESLKKDSTYAEKSWGSYKVIDVQEASTTILVTLKENNKMKYHSHEHRDEVWTIIEGFGKTTIDGIEKYVSVGDVITMEANTPHTIMAINGDLKLIEVQLGKDIDVNDKRKYE